MGISGLRLMVLTFVLTALTLASDARASEVSLRVLATDDGLCAAYFSHQVMASVRGADNWQDVAVCLDKKWHTDPSMSWLFYRHGELAKGLDNLPQPLDSLVQRFCFQLCKDEGCCR